MLPGRSELETEDNNCTSLFAPLKVDTLDMCQLIKSALNKHFNTRCKSNSPPDSYQVIPHSPICPKLLKSQNSLHMRNLQLGGICGSLCREPMITWRRQEPMWRSCFPRRTKQESVHFTLWTGNEVASADVQFLRAPSPDLSAALWSPSGTLGGTRRCLSESGNPGEDKSLDSFH